MRLALLLMVSFLGFATQAIAGPGDPTIRILNVYTSQFTAAISGNDINSLVNQQIGYLNMALADSGVRLNVVSAGTIKTSSLSNDYSYAFSQVMNSYSIQKTRDDLNADVVMVLAYSSAPISLVFRVFPQNADEAVALISASAINSFGYLHEFGHFLGARHQASGGANPEGNDPAGIGHGWYQRVNHLSGPGFVAPRQKLSSCSHTVMAYDPMPNLNGINCISYPVMRYSNPATCQDWSGALAWDGTSMGCLPWGDSLHNNAAVMNSRISTVATFRFKKLAPRVVSKSVINILNIVGLD
jgi:Metallo-peptidase family M12B Reprolysin-like